MASEKLKISLPRDDLESAPLNGTTERNAFLQHLHEVAERDPRFSQPAPSPFKRASLVIFVVFLFWMAFSMRSSIFSTITEIEMQRQNERYSEEFFFRPAASPIITTTLADGSVHVKGALPTAL